MNPLLELKLNTTPEAFIREMCRMSADYMYQSRPPEQVLKVEVRITRHDYKSLEQPLDFIQGLTSQEIAALTQGASSEWVFLFHVHYIKLEMIWKESIWIELHNIAGTHPLLVAFSGPMEDIAFFFRYVLKRCAVLWDAQVASFDPDTHAFSTLLDSEDVEADLWLSQLERTVWGVYYDKWAPTSQRKQEALERAAEEHASETHVTPSLTQVAPEVQTVSPSSQTKPKESGKKNDGTDENLDELRKKFEQKQRGEYKGTWTKACGEIGIDPKTANKYLSDLKDQWMSMDHLKKQTKNDT